MIISLIVVKIQTESSSSLKRLVKAVGPKSRAPSEIHSILIFHYRPYHFPGLFVQKVIIELKKSKILNFLKNGTSDRKTFLGPNEHQFELHFPQVGLWYTESKNNPPRVNNHAY